MAGFFAPEGAFKTKVVPALQRGTRKFAFHAVWIGTILLSVDLHLSIFKHLVGNLTNSPIVFMLAPLLIIFTAVVTYFAINMLLPVFAVFFLEYEQLKDPKLIIKMGERFRKLDLSSPQVLLLKENVPFFTNHIIGFFMWPRPFGSILFLNESQFKELSFEEFDTIASFNTIRSKFYRFINVPLLFFTTVPSLVSISLFIGTSLSRWLPEGSESTSDVLVLSMIFIITAFGTYLLKQFFNERLMAIDFRAMRTFELDTETYFSAIKKIDPDFENPITEKFPILRKLNILERKDSYLQEVLHCPDDENTIELLPWVKAKWLPLTLTGVLTLSSYITITIKDPLMGTSVAAAGGGFEINNEKIPGENTQTQGENSQVQQNVSAQQPETNSQTQVAQNGAEQAANQALPQKNTDNIDVAANSLDTNTPANDINKNENEVNKAEVKPGIDIDPTPLVSNEPSPQGATISKQKTSTETNSLKKETLNTESMNTTVGSEEFAQAVESGELRQILNLMAQGKSLKNRNPKFNGATPLLLAAKKGDLQMIYLLLTLGARLDETDDSGKSTLFYALDAQNKDKVVAYLLQGKLNVNQISQSGLTAYDIAKANGWVSIVNMLEKAGGKNAGSVLAEEKLNKKSPAKNPKQLATQTKKPPVSKKPASISKPKPVSLKSKDPVKNSNGNPDANESKASNKDITSSNKDLSPDLSPTSVHSQNSSSESASTSELKSSTSPSTVSPVENSAFNTNPNGNLNAEESKSVEDLFNSPSDPTAVPDERIQPKLVEDKASELDRKPAEQQLPGETQQLPDKK